MKIVYCWRCREEVPALDEDEFSEIERLYRDATERVKEYRAEHGCSLEDTPVDEIYAPVRQAYATLTGQDGVHQDEILKHRAASFGPPCGTCGKNLRTPATRECVECGTLTRERRP